MIRPTPARFLRSPAASACALSGAGALGLTGLALFGAYPPGDATIATTIQGISFPGQDLLSDGIYYGGLTPIIQIITLALAGFLLWRGRALAAGFLGLTMLARVISLVIKDIAERPRPTLLDVNVSENAAGFSFPSSHVFGTTLVMGFLIFLAQELIPNVRARLAVQGSALLIIIFMGLQRVYAGAHWPTDVLGAWLWGALTVFAMGFLYKAAHNRLPDSAAAEPVVATSA